MRESQQIAGLTWDFCKPRVSEDVLQEHERALGVEFPSLFRELIGMCHGGDPIERKAFDVQHPSLGLIQAEIGALVTLEPVDDVDGMRYATRVLREVHRVPERVIPFATNGAGDYICLDFRTDGQAPSVIYWAHEANPEEALAPVVGTLAAFLAMLKPSDDNA